VIIDRLKRNIDMREIESDDAPRITWRARALRLGGLGTLLAAGVATAAAVAAASFALAISGSGPGSGELRIVESGIGSVAFRLSCEPTGGTVPDPARICAAIAADPSLLHSLPGPDHSCPAGAPMISIVGTWNHRPLHSTFSACTGGQEQHAADWAALLPARRSAFRPSMNASHAARERVGGASRTAIIGGSAAQRSLLRAILAALAPTHVRLLRLVRAHGGVKLEAPGVWDQPAWAVLVTGVPFFYRSADQHLPRVLEVDVGPIGWPTSNAGPRPPLATPASVLATHRLVHRVALASGARIEELTVSAPDSLAVVLRLRVTNAASFLQNRLRTLVLAADAHETNYDGLFIEVDDAHGIAWDEGETQLGGDSYVRPSLSGCNPFPPPGPTSSTYPRCPA
jgi:hypothetical protein